MHLLSVFRKNISVCLFGRLPFWAFAFLSVCFLTTISIFADNPCRIGAASKTETAKTETAVSGSEKENKQVPSDSSMLTASKNNLSVSFSYGFNKSSKYGRNMSVLAYVTNNGKDFSGTIGILSTPTRSSEETLYENPCTIASGETKKFELTAMVAYSNWPSLLIKDEKEHTVLQKGFHVTMTTQSDIVFTGILTDEPEDMDYISSTGLAKLFFLDEETLPSTAAGLDSLDILMISNFNTDRLSSSQNKAILEWTRKGGTLVFGTGGTASKTLSTFQESVFNGTIGDVEKRTTLLGMSKQEFLAIKEELYSSINQALDYEELLQEAELQNGTSEQAEVLEKDSIETEAETEAEVETEGLEKPGRISKTEIDALTLQEMPKDMVSMQFENFASILTESDGFPLVLKNNYGKGVILATAFELGIAGKYRTSMGAQLYHIITDNFSETGRARLNNSEYEGSYTLSRALGVNNLFSYPHLKTYFFILLAYAVFTGPVLYFILKKLDKRHLLWSLMPVSCLICTIIIYIAGTSTRITEPYIHYLSFTKIDPLAENQDNTVSQEIYFNVAAPYNKKYSVPLSNVSDVQIRGNNDYGMSYSYDNGEPKESSYYKTAIYKHNSNDTTLIMNDYASFHAACFRCNYQPGTAYLSGSFDTSLETMEDFTLTGTLTNNLGIDLHQAAYVCNGRLYILGAMENGAVVSIEDCKSSTFFSYDSLVNNTITGENLLEMLAGGNGWYSKSDPLVSQMYHTYEYYLTSDTSMYSSEGRVIAITESMPIDFLTDTGLSVSGLNLLDIPVSPANLGSIHVESLDQSFVSVIGGDSSYPTYRYLAGNQTMSYQIKDPETVTALVYDEDSEERLQEDVDTIVSYNSPVFHGTIAAYNLLTGQYDTLFTGGTAGTCEDLSSYLTANGELILRFYEDSNNDTSDMIPMLYLLRE